MSGWFKAPFKATNDPNITCLICRQDHCEYEVMLKDKPQGITHWVGLHDKCLKGHEEYMKWWAITNENREDDEDE
jgi:hypothetical protein